MGLLDKLVSDLIKNSTGFNAKKLVRKVGGGKLLLAGGAALAGALAMEKMKQQGSGASPAASARFPPTPQSPLPPLPPTPSPPAAPATELPPLPPVPQPSASSLVEETAEEELPPELEYAVVRTLVAAALADGHLGDGERQIILSRIDEADLPEEKVRQLHRDLVLPPTPSQLARLVPDTASRETLYSFAALMTRSDGASEAAETEWLARFGSTLEISPERCAELCRQAAAS